MKTLKRIRLAWLMLFAIDPRRVMLKETSNCDVTFELTPNGVDALKAFTSQLESNTVTLSMKRQIA